jgi:hypothetical protein
MLLLACFPLNFDIAVAIAKNWWSWGWVVEKNGNNQKTFLWGCGNIEKGIVIWGN